MFSGYRSLSRIVEIDTTGGPGFGFEHFKQYDFLRPNEVGLETVLRCSLITNHPNGRRVSVHWFAGVLQSLCSLS